MRMIDADRLKDAIYTDFWEHFTQCHDSSQTALIDMVMYDIDEMPTITPPNEWVSVEERLPENNAQVLMWSAKWNIAEAGSYYNGRFWVYSEIGDRYIADDITHWMSLPAPPDRRPPENDAESPFENNKNKFMEE